MASEMEERVARAIAEKYAPAVNQNSPYAKVMVQAAARAAIEAMRVLTEAMVEAGAKAAYGSFTNPPNPWPDVHTHIEAEGYREAYRAAHAAMIDAALEE
jgi:hypothetical protein